MEHYTHSGDTQFVLANESQIRLAQREAKNWFHQKNQMAHRGNEHTARSAVAEYILNRKGFTMYEMNAIYPKKVKVS